MTFDPLDATLPANLQGVVTRETKATEPKPKGEEIMANENQTLATAALQAIDILTPDKIRAIATELFNQKDAEKAIASKIQDLTNAGEAFKASLTKEIAAGVAKSGELATASEKVSSLSAELATANKAIAEANKATAAVTAELNKFKSERAIASRTDALTKAGMGTKPLIEKFTAVAEDGTLKVSDEAFTAAVAELKSVFEAGKASTTPVVPAAAAAGAPVVEKKVEAPAQAVAEQVAPKAPDLSTIDAQTQAIASLASGAAAPATATGKSKYAQAFGAGI